jgi:RNA polymerase sigma factor (sigma-70 family)
MVGMQRGDDPPTVTEAFQAGDERALATVYARWSPLVYSLALRSLPDVSEAEQVTQRVFTGAWAARRAFDPARGPLSAWLIAITRREIADAAGARSERASERTPMSSQPQPEGRAAAPADLAERLLVADEMSRFDAVPQQVLRMAFDDDLTHAQIAERTGLPRGTVMGHLSHGLLKLRERLEVLTDAH